MPIFTCNSNPNQVQRQAAEKAKANAADAAAAIQKARRTAEI